MHGIESFLIEKNIATHDAIDTLVAVFENDLGPMQGASVVAKAMRSLDASTISSASVT